MAIELGIFRKGKITGGASRVLPDNLKGEGRDTGEEETQPVSVEKSSGDEVSPVTVIGLIVAEMAGRALEPLERIFENALCKARGNCYIRARESN